MGRRRRTGRTSNSQFIAATPEQVFRAFTDAAALASWLVPGEMTATAHEFDARVGGGYSMTLRYPAAEPPNSGKSGDWEDRYTARYLALDRPHRIVEAIQFDTSDPDFAGDMIMTVSLAEANGGTMVTIAFSNIPAGIRPEDNEAGTASSLEKLAAYLETISSD